MPVTDYQGSTSSPFSFGRSLLSLRRDTTAMPSGEEVDLEAFQRHVAATLAELLPGGEAGGDAAAGGEEFLSVAWIRRLLEAFVICQEEFRVVVAQARRRGALPAAAEKMVAEFHERAVKALDVCNAARDGVDQVRRWERLADIAASVLRGPADIHEGQLRRARKALSDLSGSSSTTPQRPAVASTSVSTRTSPREQGQGQGQQVPEVSYMLQRWSRRSGRTMACASKLFDGIPLKMHKCPWCLSCRSACWVAMGNGDGEHPVVGCLVLHVGLVGARARGWPAGAVAGNA